MGQVRKIDLVLTGKNLDGDTRFTNPADRKRWAEQFAGEQWTCTFKLIGSLNDKARLFAYLHGPLLQTALAYFEETGQYDQLSTTQLYYDFKNMFATHTRYNTITQKEEVSIYDYSAKDVSVDLLKKFLDDIIRYLEETFDNFTAPDSDAYKVHKKYGPRFKAVSKFDNNLDK